MFYEYHNSLNSDLIRTECGTDFNFPPHLHSSFEFITVTEGEMRVQIDGTDYIIHPGESLLIFPNQIHSLCTDSHSVHFLCIFSEKLVQSYSGVYRTQIPENNFLILKSFDIDALSEIDTKTVTANLLRVKSLLYSLCAEFDLNRRYVAKKKDGDTLLSKIFHFVETEYKNDCTLSSLSQRLSYHYVYLSRYFKQLTGASFIDFVNSYRINEACYMLKNNPPSVLQVAYDCGFDSLRSFNRNFKKVTGVTPREYQALAMSSAVNA
ncbi:MAG: AraC family transcriptional regulator [Clostridia bacterium]|nr:AraC family transcriptional regulator [Clostridia bacterium]